MAELDAAYITTMENVQALYETPYDPQEPVVCLDEKPVFLHAEVRPGRPARPGHVAKRDNEYKRRGTANTFGVVEPKAGRHLTCPTSDRSAIQFARMLRAVMAAYPGVRTIHLLMDNLNTHGEVSLTKAFGRRTARRPWRRLTVHYMPKHRSWLNQAEIELSLVARQCLGTQRIPALAHLQSATRAWKTHANRARTCLRWRFTRQEARMKFGYQSKPSTRSKT